MFLFFLRSSFFFLARLRLSLRLLRASSSIKEGEAPRRATRVLRFVTLLKTLPGITRVPSSRRSSGPMALLLILPGTPLAAGSIGLVIVVAIVVVVVGGGVAVAVVVVAAASRPSLVTGVFAWVFFSFPPPYLNGMRAGSEAVALGVSGQRFHEHRTPYHED